MNMLNTQWIAKEQLRFLSAYFNDFSIIFCLANVKLSGAMNSDLKYIRINKSEQHVFQSTYVLCFSFESDQKVRALYSQKLSQVIQASSWLFLGMDREVNLSLCLNFQWIGNTQYITLHATIRTFIVSSNHWFHIHKNCICIADIWNDYISNYAIESAVSLYSFWFSSHFLHK